MPGKATKPVSLPLLTSDSRIERKKQMLSDTMRSVHSVALIGTHTIPGELPWWIICKQSTLEFMDT
jgi:hypothetical protein